MLVQLMSIRSLRRNDQLIDKVKRISFGLFILIANLSFSQTQNNNIVKVILYRKDQLYSGNNFAIFADNQKICWLSNARYLMYESKPGKLILSANLGIVSLLKRKKSYLTLEVEVGRTYYINCIVKKTHHSHSRTPDIELEMWEVSESIAKLELMKLKPDHCMTKD